MSLFRKKKAKSEFEAKKENMINIFERLKENRTKSYFDINANILLKGKMLVAFTNYNKNKLWSVLVNQGKDNYFFRQFEEFSIIDDNHKKMDYIRVYQDKEFMEYRVDLIDTKSTTDESVIVLNAIETFKKELELRDELASIK